MQQETAIDDDHVEPLEDREKKSWITAYALYFFFGFTGIQHFYLGRDFYAFLLGSTFGGFGVGLIMDLFCLYDYVEDTNEEQFTMAVFSATRESQKKPSISVGRLLYQWLTALLYYAIFTNALPTFLPYYTLITLVVGPVAIATGVWIAGNYGRQQTGFVYPLFAAIIFHTWLHFYPTETIGGRAGAIIAAVGVAQWKREFRSRRDGPARRRRRIGFCRRALAVSFGACLLTTGWTAVILFNAEVTNEYGESMKLSEAIMNLVRSPAFAEFTRTLRQIWTEFNKARKSDGTWEDFANRMKVLFDMGGEERSLAVLGLSRDATDAEIKKTYRKLARQWHPDHNQGQAEEASRKFIEIQKAYELLVKARSLRGKKHAQSSHFHNEKHVHTHSFTGTTDRNGWRSHGDEL